MAFLTQKSFNQRVKNLNSGYWNEGAYYRWEYMQCAIQMMKKINAVKTLEFGTFYIPLNSKSYLIELEDKFLVTGSGKIHDLNIIPYMLPEKSFDCACGLQVWEHLDKQPQAFQELMRISKNIILSFPYKWKHGDDRHRGIDDQKISDWTCGIAPTEKKLIKDRMVCLWRL